MEWVIDKIQIEVMDLANSAVKSTDEFMSQTRHQIDDLTNMTKRGMDNLQDAANKSLDYTHNLASQPSYQSMPKL